MTSLIDFACKLASSSWSLQDSGSLWWRYLCTTPHSTRTANAPTWLVTHVETSAGLLTSGLDSSHWETCPSSHNVQHLAVNPPFPEPLKRLTRLCKKTEWWFISAWMQLQIKTTLKRRKRKIYIKPHWNACFPETHWWKNTKTFKWRPSMIYLLYISSCSSCNLPQLFGWADLGVNLELPCHFAVSPLLALLS